MDKELVPYQEALELKELGFSEPCFVRVWWLNSVHYQTKVPFKPHITMNGHDIKFEYPIPEKHPLTEFGFLELQVPTFSQAFRWFREKYDLRIWIESNRGVLFYEYIIATTNPSFINRQFTNNEVFDTYEEAEQACLRKLIEIVKQNG